MSPVKYQKFNQKTFKDLIDFTERLMHYAASHLSRRKELRGVVQNRRLLWQKGEDSGVGTYL